MVDQLMLQRETLLGRAVAPVEQWRHDDALVQHANRHGTVHGLALYDADAAELLGIALAWAGTDAEQEGAVGRLVPDQECDRSEEHTSELQSLMRNSYAVFCLKKKKRNTHTTIINSN